MVNAASALGEAIGKLIEEGMNEIIESLIKKRGYKCGKKKILDKTGIDFQIDAPIYNERNELIALIDIKYLRYKKHARDKGSWVIVAHNRLKATFPTIKKSIVILLGTGWSESAKKMISTSGINVITIETTLIDRVLSNYGINFIWEEKDDSTPKKSWEKYQALSADKKQAIKRDIIRISNIEKILDDWLNNKLPKRPGPTFKLDYITEDKRINLEDFIFGKE